MQQISWEHDQLADFLCTNVKNVYEGNTLTAKIGLLVTPKAILTLPRMVMA